MVPVGSDHVIVLAHEGAAPDRDGFLADVKMEESANLLGLVGTETAFLETPDPQHLAEELKLVVAGELRVDGRPEILRTLKGRLGLLFGSGSRFLTHERRVD